MSHELFSIAPIGPAVPLKKVELLLPLAEQLLGVDISITQLAQRALQSAEGQTVNDHMALYLEENREASKVAYERQEKIRFHEKIVQDNHDTRGFSKWSVSVQSQLGERNQQRLEDSPVRTS